MKKNIKKLFSTFIAVIMLMAMSTTVFAADSSTHTITVNGVNGHEYSAYQVFKGDLSSGKLVNIEWGNGVEGSALLAELKNKDGYSNCKTAADVAGVLSGFENNSAQIKAFAEAAGNNLKAAAGKSSQNNAPYTITVNGAGYYLIKDTGSTPAGGTMTEYLLKVTDNVAITTKDKTVTSQKKVKDVLDSSGEFTGWQDSADYDMGDKVPFQLKATLPANFDAYKSFSLTFHDYEETDALSIVEDTIKVAVDGNAVAAEKYQVITKPSCDCSFDVYIPDVKTIGARNNSEITVEYESVLTEKANLGESGNENTMYVTYTNDMYYNCVGNYENREDDEKGETNPDSVIVFTYQTVINKVDASGNPLSGAEFKLQKKNGDTWKDIAAVKNKEGTVFTFKGLDDGEYKLVETAAPAGYNKIDDIAFTVSASHDIESDDPQLNELTGNVTDGSIVFAADDAKSTLSTSVENRQGAVLPSTGGMGTTIFYILGALLVIGAGILFVTKRRMNA